jgi:type IV pilus assembly protein PilW
MSTIFSLISRKRGFSLVELMIAMVLGLFLIGGVVSVFLANRQVYRQNESLARMQENARYVFEVVGRDVREAAGVPCGSNTMSTTNLLFSTTSWWANWDYGIHGYEGTETLPAKATGTNPTERVNGTDAVYVLSSSGNSFITIVAHSPSITIPIFTANVSTHGFIVGDILMACDYNNAALFQVTSISGSNIGYKSGTSNSPGNKANILSLLGRDPNATPIPPDPDPLHPAIGQLAKLSANAWYIGNNGRGGRSLYRIPLRTVSGDAQEGVAEEMAEGVNDLQLKYLVKEDDSGNLPDSYVDADSITTSDEWKRVVAVRIVFTLASLETVGTNNAALTRTWNTVVTLRNRQL